MGSGEVPALGLCVRRFGRGHALCDVLALNKLVPRPGIDASARGENPTNAAWVADCLFGLLVGWLPGEVNQIAVRHFTVDELLCISGEVSRPVVQPHFDDDGSCDPSRSKLFQTASVLLSS